MDVGFTRAGFKTIWAADKNSAACATYNRYAEREIALRRDLAKEDFKELRQQLACTPDLVCGGPRINSANPWLGHAGRHKTQSSEC